MPSPTQAALDERSRRPTLYLAVAGVISLIILASLGLSAWSSHRTLTSFMHRELRVQELQGVITHLDEVLTMSARMGAATGDVAWEERYREFAPQLDAAIAEVYELVPGLTGTAQTDDANQRLVEMEDRSFELIRGDRAPEALALVLGDEYASEKSRYADGMRELHEQLRSTARAAGRAQARRAVVHIIAAAVAIPLLVVGWIFVLRLLREWRRDLLAELTHRQELERAVAGSTQEVAGAAAQISASARMLGETVQGFRGATGRAMTAVHEIAATAAALTQTMHEVSDLSRNAAGRATTGQDGLEHLGRAMDGIRDAAAVLGSKIDVIRENAAKINVATSTMVKVADQTDLLSVNSAIEAEKAGRHAEGFRVISREIRRIADSTAESTLEIESVVEGIHDSVSDGISEVSRFAEQTHQGVETVAEVADGLGQIIIGVGELSSRFAAISEAMVEQSAGTDQIRTSIGELDRGAERFTESSAEFARVTDRLRTVVQNLEEQVLSLTREDSTPSEHDGSH